MRDSPLVLNRMQQEERLQAVLVRAAADALSAGGGGASPRGHRLRARRDGPRRRPRARRSPSAHALRAGRGLDDVPLLRALVQQGIGTILASEQSRHQEERRGSLVLTPGEALTDPASSRPGRTRA